MQDALARVEKLFAARKVDEAMNELFGVIHAVDGKPRERDALMAWIIERVGDDHPQIGAHIALAGGALVEGGADPGAIGRAIMAPVEKALRDAHRMVALAEKHGHQHSAEDHDHDHGHDHSHDHDHDHSHDHDHDHDNGGAHVHGAAHDHDHDHSHDHSHDHGHQHVTEVRGWALSEENIQAIAALDVAAVRAWFSLDMWYRPAVACWSRDPALLADVQRNASLREAMVGLTHETPTSHWLTLLTTATVKAPFVVLVPELSEAWSFTADGVVDMGQLTVLLSKHLADPLRRIGGSPSATKDQLAVMTGDGEQSADSGYSSNFAFYPVEATDPTDGLPRDGIHLWSAPGGTGSHSLPGDFLPGDLEPIDGVRVLVMVGPKAPGMRFVRIIQTSRMFEALHASITDVKNLPAAQVAPLFEIAKQRGKRARQS